jgi:predicted acylesterase/phospholipase RssA
MEAVEAGEAGALFLALLALSALLVVIAVVAVDGCRYENIVFGAGGIKGAAHVGVLAFMHEHGHMRRAKRFAGSSVGAVTAAACALRMDVSKMGRVWSDLDYAALVTMVDAPDRRGTTALGKFTGNAMHAFFRRLFERETGNPDMTFRELHRARGTTLVVAVTCLSTMRCVYLTHTDPDHADMPVALALRISCSLPFVLEPVRYKGLLFADGGITDDLPLAAFDGHEAHKTLGIELLSRAEALEEVERRAYSADRSRLRRVMRVQTDTPGGFTRVVNEDTDALIRRGYSEARRFFSESGRGPRIGADARRVAH